MGFQYSPKIVTDGLVLYLDAANPKSIVSGSTTWNDMSRGGNNGTLVNGPVYSGANGGSIFFDGVDDRVTTAYVSQLGDFTATVWFKSSPPGTGNYERILEKSYANGFWMGRNQNVANQWGGGILNTTAPTFGIFITLRDSSWHSLTIIRNGSTQILYGDGISNTNSSICPTTLLSSTSLTLGTDFSFGNLKGNISQVSIYNRALSAAEVLQNYNTTKGRYGL